MGWSGRGHSRNKGLEVGTTAKPTWELDEVRMLEGCVDREGRGERQAGASCVWGFGHYSKLVVSRWRTLHERMPRFRLGWMLRLLGRDGLERWKQRRESRREAGPSCLGTEPTLVWPRVAVVETERGQTCVLL